MSTQIDCPVCATKADGIDAPTNITLADVIAWLDDLHQYLPDVPPTEVGFATLLIIAEKIEQMHERTVDLLVQQLRANPNLQNLIDALQSEETDLTAEQR